MTKVKLSKPVNLDGQKIEEINLDLDSLTGADVIAINKQLKAKGERFNVLDQETLTEVAAKASNMIPEDLQKLSMFDFTEVNGHVQLFLMGQGFESPENSEQ